MSFSPSAPSPHARRTGRVFAIALVVVLVMGAGIFASVLFRSRIYSPPRTLGPLLRVDAEDGGRVYMLTVQHRIVHVGRRYGSSRTWRTDQYLDVWAFRASEGSPLWRRRLLTERASTLSGCRMLGADGRALWVLM